MDPLYLKQTTYSPEIDFDISKDVFLIKGSAYSEDPVKFFTPILEWVERYTQAPKPSSVFHFRVDYMNSTSLKLFLAMINMLKRIQENGDSLEIHWFYNNDNQHIFEAGERISAITKMEFKIIEFTESD